MQFTGCNLQLVASSHDYELHCVFVPLCGVCVCVCAFVCMIVRMRMCACVRTPTHTCTGLAGRLLLNLQRKRKGTLQVHQRHAARHRRALGVGSTRL